ncbi:homeobox protein CHOX-CAD-like [Nelusetta ayraudi]|uniref:homeobox protein CHOX-CAD-like n=1 Tax=Nelusetta ayraudi TaxID=303726 RepID=UPI003F72075D
MYNTQLAARSTQTQYIPPTYDFSGYHHHVPGVGDPSTNAWNSVYAPREEYPFCYPVSTPSPGQLSFSPPELSNTPTATGGGSFTTYNFISGLQDPLSPRRRSQESIKPAASGGKTRTKDKYRVVYTDKQRLELEKEFQYNHYITMRRKSELSAALALSERQVKIWFQNRRAKERKINRKKLQHSQQASTTTPASPALGSSTSTPIAPSPIRNMLSDTVSDDY